MIEGLYKKSSCPEDQRLNNFVFVLDHAVAHGDLTPHEAMELYYEYKSAPEAPVNNLDEISESSAVNLNGVLRSIFDRN